ncbi:MAG: tail fiber domain-containing protein [Symploca sp. SIO2G7]|nr:tail fiber domain-containing protein [Symploca sp. SIO2G7]
MTEAVVTIQRDINILLKFDSNSTVTQILYEPGTLNLDTAFSGIINYTGKISCLTMISHLDYHQKVSLYIDDSDNVRYQLLSDYTIRPKSCPTNILDLMGEKELIIAPNSQLIMSIGNISSLVSYPTNYITVIGHSLEYSYLKASESDSVVAAMIGQPNGIAPLNKEKVVPKEYLPAWTEDDDLADAIANKQAKGDYALNPHEHSQYQGAGNYALDPHEHSQYQKTGNYALDSHEHTIESIFGRNVISQKDPVPFGDIQINQVSPKWGGIRFHQPNNPLSKDWILMINHDDVYASYQGIYSPDIGWIFYIPPDKKIRGYGFITISDEKEKKNIHSFSDVLDKIEQVTPVLFTWKNSDNNDEDYGFIAQNIRPIFPQAVEEELIDPTKPELGYRLVLEDKQLTSILWQGLKEIIEEIRQIKESIRLTP